jgi:hypothetical protein
MITMNTKTTITNAPRFNVLRVGTLLQRLVPLLFVALFAPMASAQDAPASPLAAPVIEEPQALPDAVITPAIDGAHPADLPKTRPQATVRRQRSELRSSDPAVLAEPAKLGEPLPSVVQP